MRVLIAEDEPYLADAVRDALRLEAIAADVVHDGDNALENLAVNGYDVVVLDRDLPGTSGDDVARRIVADSLPCRILMLTAADAWRRRSRASSSGPTTTSPSPSRCGSWWCGYARWAAGRSTQRPPWWSSPV